MSEEIKHFSEMELDIIPAGKYRVRIVDTSIFMKDDKTQVVLNLEVDHGVYQGFRFKDYYLRDGSVQKAVEYGLAKYKRLCKAIGVKEDSHYTSLVGHTFSCDITVKTDVYYGFRNFIKGFMPKHINLSKLGEKKKLEYSVLDISVDYYMAKTGNEMFKVVYKLSDGEIIEYWNFSGSEPARKFATSRFHDITGQSSPISSNEEFMKAKGLVTSAKGVSVVVKLDGLKKVISQIKKSVDS